MSKTNAAPHADNASASSATILVVDDEPMVRMLLAESLRDAGYRVREAGDAADAIASLQLDRSVDLVFSDVRMPGELDGFGLARWIRRHTPEIRVLLTSGWPGEECSSNRHLDVPLVSKPYSQRHLIDLIGGLMQRQPRIACDRHAATQSDFPLIVQ
jgi:CheY-like chemotaxis protein